MAEVFPNHRWRDDNGVVHRVSAGEARTPCGIALGDNHFAYTRDATTCLWCVVGMFIGWRKPSWPNNT